MKGCFFSFEGPDGAGKTTMIAKLETFLREKGFAVLSTREPGGVRIAEAIRSIILNPDHTEMDGRTEALLYAAARRQHLLEKIIPAVEAGNIVLCDRFVDSSLVYQGFARGLGVDEVLQINQFAIDGYFPSLTIYFDIDPKMGLERIQKNKQREINRLDMESLSFHYKVREGYLKLAERFSERIVTIDASKPVDEVFAMTVTAVMKQIEGR
ncbi:dTMP kinase [Parageobacillus sp. VR-IP]|mgnify:CR=1 FL=1|jgi:dTMP kinase|uniref:Thymidylate kinase n=2 Tax=Saccharococcus caldoxylosilyticus TaxID=81408 RepID=A0A023DH20_9BACL|nr:MULTISPECIES: dTMP kinase [Parageobacillus]OQO99150.1 dTMP kinase [Geobacillus sp. 44B]KYD05833.1 Thymidylate kinase [Parageobacillus caldoxylosilyticus]MBB3853793.1 dTMP kinase [Parageobacillus caldoxylosilyticus]NUK32051.1 dTMP kinase [Parageobacillus sp. VR-IP]QNU38663.1 dTMP kinase [Geobacillus sp. 44B]